MANKKIAINEWFTMYFHCNEMQSFKISKMLIKHGFSHIMRGVENSDEVLMQIECSLSESTIVIKKEIEKILNK